MSYVFGATLALAGITDRQARHMQAKHSMCAVCDDVISDSLRTWLTIAHAVQCVEARALWVTPMSMAQGRLVTERYEELVVARA
jgi:hypothetical protein